MTPPRPSDPAPPPLLVRLSDKWKASLLIVGILSAGFGGGVTVSGFVTAPAQNTRRIERLEELVSTMERTQAETQARSAERVERLTREMKLVNCNLRVLRNPAFDFAGCTSEIQ